MKPGHMLRGKTAVPYAWLMGLQWTMKTPKIFSSLSSTMVSGHARVTELTAEL